MKLRLCVRLPMHPCKKSDAGVGACLVIYHKPDILYGDWLIIGYFGRFALQISERQGIESCSDFATAVGDV